MTAPDDTRDRPLQLATRSTKLLGLVSAGYGIFFCFAYGYLNRYQTYAAYFIAMGMIVWVLPGVTFLVQAKQLEDRKRSAAIIAMLAAIFQGVCAAGLFVANFFFTPISVIPVVLSLLWVIAIVQMIAHLYRSLPLLEIDAQRRHGFDVSTPQQVLPVESHGERHEPGAS
jgi:hypothetical protein